MSDENETQQPMSVAEQTLAVLLTLNENMADIKTLASIGKAMTVAKGKPAKASDAEWAQRIERNKAAGRSMETARFYCGGCEFHCYNEVPMNKHCSKRGGDHVKKDV